MHLALKPSKLNHVSIPVPYQYLENIYMELSNPWNNTPLWKEHKYQHMQRCAQLLISLPPWPQWSLNRMGSKYPSALSYPWQKTRMLVETWPKHTYYIILHHITSTINYHEMTLISEDFWRAAVFWPMTGSQSLLLPRVGLAPRWSSPALWPPASSWKNHHQLGGPSSRIPHAPN